MAPKRRERWYSLEGQRQIHQAALQSNTGPRRLISLIVLLILVLMMIQQVSDSRKVAKVAGALGLLPPPTANPDQPANSTQSTQDPTQLPSVAESDASRPLNQAQIIESLGLVSSDAKIQRWSEILAILMKDLSSQDKATLAGKIFDIADQPKKSAQPQSLPDDSESILANQIASWQKILLRWIDLSDSQNPEHRWIEELQVALESWPNPQSPETIQRSLRLALDRSVLGDLTDNTPWKTTERVSLARLLVRATQLAGHFQDTLYIEAVPSISIPQLLSQTDTLRGRCYRIRGTIGLIEPTSSIELANGRKLTYSVLWLRPDDLSDQPINIYIPQGVLADRELIVGDTLEVAGLIAKRRAYASKRGGEIAPVLIATCLEIDPPPNAPKSSLQKDSFRLAQSLALAKEVSNRREQPAWTPPVDRQAPLDLIQQSLAKHLQDLTSNDPLTLDRNELANSIASLATLANLVKFQNEVETVISGGNSAMLRVAPADPPKASSYTPVLGTWQGVVVGVQAIQLNPETLPGLNWRTVYFLELKPQAIGNPQSEPKSNIRVLAQEIPALWRAASQIRQPVLIEGLGLMPSSDLKSVGKSHLSDPPSMILASKIAWQFLANSAQTLPPVNDLVPELSPGQQRLLWHGWDLSQTDTLERMHGQSLTNKDAKPFYTLLALQKKDLSINKPDEASVEKDSSRLTVMDWIRRTEANKQSKRDDGSLKRSVGERVTARVQVRRIQRVEVQNAAHQNWLNGNHYYQLDGVADIGQNRIDVRYGKDSEPISYEKEFPITLVAATLPTWILTDPTTQSSKSEDSQETSDLDASSTIAWSTKIRVDVQGFAYRIWRFQTPQVSAVTQGKGYQQAPMLVVDRWQLSRGPTASDQPTRKTDVSVGSVLTTILGLSAIGWFAYRMISQPRKPTIKRK